MQSKENNLAALQVHYKKIAQNYPDLDGLDRLLKYLESRLPDLLSSPKLLLKYIKNLRNNSDPNNVPINLITIISNIEDQLFKEELKELRCQEFIDFFFSLRGDSLEEGIQSFADNFCNIFEDQHIDDIEQTFAGADYACELKNVDIPAGQEVELDLDETNTFPLKEKLQNLIDTIGIEIEHYNNNKGPFTFKMARKADEIQKALNRALIWLEEVTFENDYENSDFKVLCHDFLNAHIDNHKSLYDALNYHRFLPTINGVSFFPKSQTSSLDRVIDDIDRIVISNKMKTW